MRLRKVSTNFKATVERSVQIQQKISFKSIDLPRDGMVTINPLLLPILRHYGVVVIVTTLIKAQLNFCIRENDENQLRVYFNERIELVIVSIDKRIFTKACLPQTFKKMLVTDWLIDIGVVGHCNGDLDRSATLGDLIKSCNKRSTAIQSSSRGLSGRQLGEDYRSRKYEPKSMVVRRSSHYDVDRRGETEGC